MPSIGKVAHAQPPQLIYKDGPALKVSYTQSPTLFEDVIKARDARIAHTKALLTATKRAIALQKQRAAEIAAQNAATRLTKEVAPVYNPSSVQSMIVHWANVYGVSSSWMLNIARCESTYNPSEAYLGHLGLYQYLESTWADYSAQAGVSASIWDGNAQAHVTAWALANGHASAWTCA